MLMCDNCFELFTSKKLEEDDSCPVFQCFGDLKFIDDSIAWHVSTINKVFKEKNIPFQTEYCCSSHIGHKEIDEYAYISFKNIHRYDCYNNKHVIKEEVITLKSYLQVLVIKLNDSLKDIYPPGELYTLSDDIYTTKFGEVFHRIFVSQAEVVDEDKIRVGASEQNKIEYEFKSFLISTINNVANLSESFFKLYSGC